MLCTSQMDHTINMIFFYSIWKMLLSIVRLKMESTIYTFLCCFLPFTFAGDLSDVINSPKDIAEKYMTTEATTATEEAEEEKRRRGRGEEEKELQSFVKRQYTVGDGKQFDCNRHAQFKNGDPN